MTRKPIDDQRLRSAKIVKGLPSIYGPREEIPAGLEGSRIVAIGALHDRTLVEGGGLVIDFIPAGHKRRCRVVLGASELGVWVEAVLQE